MNTITVFTPSFNRAHTLPRLYESLQRQTSKNFDWLIVDDGSSDNTKELVRGWIDQGNISIRYIRQANKGMLGAHNTAYDNISSTLAICIDSDDYLVDDGIESILNAWELESRQEHIAGFIGLDAFESGEIIGNKFPTTLTEATFMEIRRKYRIKGDKKCVYRMSVINEFGRFPEIQGEHFPASSYLYRKIDQKYKLRIINRPLCIVEYQAGGNSKQKIKQYQRNPNAFMLYREYCMQHPFDIREKITHAIHYVSSCFFSHRYGKIFMNRNGLLTTLVSPFGALLYLYFRHTRKSGFLR